MRKLIGASCVLIACGCGWYLQKQQRIRQRKVRREMISVLGSMAEEIGTLQTPLPRLLSELGEIGRGEVCTRLLRLKGLLENGISAAEAWEQVFADLPLPKEEVQRIGELGKQINRELSTSIKEIYFTQKLLKKRQEQETGECAELEKRSAALWFSAAMMLVIVLS